MWPLCLFSFLPLGVMFSKCIHVVACLSVPRFFLWLNNVIVLIYCIFCLSTQLMDTCVVSASWLLWILQLWTFVYKFLCGPKFSFLLVISFKHLMVLILIFRSLIHFCMWCIVGIQFHPFGMWLSSHTSNNCWKDYFLMNGLGTLVKKQLTINIRLYFWTLNFIPLFCMSILMPVTTLFGLL